jgi:hypothetical protein
MKIHTICAAIALGFATLSTAAYAQDMLGQAAQTVVANTDPVRMHAIVASINREGNVMVLRGPAGREVGVPALVSPVTGRPVGVGDTVNVSYKSTLLLSAEKLEGGRDGIRENVDTVVYAATANGYEAAHEMDVKATVQKIDTARRELTLRGTREVFTLPVPKDVDLDALRVGDTVRAVYVSVYALEAS